MNKPLLAAAALLTTLSVGASRAYACDPITTSPPLSITPNESDVVPPDPPFIYETTLDQTRHAGGECNVRGAFVVKLSRVYDDVSPQADIGFLLEPVDGTAPFDFPAEALTAFVHSDGDAQVQIAFGYTSSLAKFAFQARSVDAAGNKSAPSARFEVTPDPKRIYTPEGCSIGTHQADPGSAAGLFVLVAVAFVIARRRAAQQT